MNKKPNDLKKTDILIKGFFDWQLGYFPEIKSK